MLGICIILNGKRKDGSLAALLRRPMPRLVLLFAVAGATVFGASFAPSQDAIFGKLGITKAGRPVSWPTCFLNQVHHPQARKIAQATVFIAVVRSDGTLASEGTGFVVSGSRVGGAQGPRIVTAAHVVDGIDATRNGRRPVLFFSDGVQLGLPRTVVRGPRNDLSAGGFDLVANDIAVLEIASFANDAARRRFLALDGLPLAGGDDILAGETSRPLGAAWGFSGAAAIDPTGRVVGVLTGADFRDRTTLALASILDAAQSGTVVPRLVTLPNRSLVIVEPLQSPDILHALGRSPEPKRSAPRTTVSLVGFPLASCAATSAIVAPINTPAGTSLLSQWRSIGMEGAWYLQPPLGTGKILPTVGAR
jgi:hypothetical protein